MSYLREPIYWVDKEAEAKACDVFMHDAGFNRDLAGLMAKFCAPRIKIVPFVMSAMRRDSGGWGASGIYRPDRQNLIDVAAKYNQTIEVHVCWLPEPLFAIWNSANRIYRELLPAYRSELFVQATVDNITSLQQLYSRVERAFREYDSRDETWEV
jgi:hypothetical protein